MKLMIASDLHGSAYFAQMLVDTMNSENADILLLLGDIYNHGPRNPFPQDYAPMKVADILNNIKDKLIVVKGNCDSEVDQMISQFQFVENALVDVDGIKVFASHGHKNNIDNMPCNSCDVFVYGHFHKAFIETKNGIIVANPSSVSLPKESINGYLIVENGTIVLKNLLNKNIIEKEVVENGKYCK